MCTLHGNVLIGISQQTRWIEPMLGQCRADVKDDGPTLAQHWVNVPCFLVFGLRMTAYRNIGLRWRKILCDNQNVPHNPIETNLTSSKSVPWRSEVDHATFRLNRLSTLLKSASERRRTILFLWAIWWWRAVKDERSVNWASNVGVFGNVKNKRSSVWVIRSPWHYKKKYILHIFIIINMIKWLRELDTSYALRNGLALTGQYASYTWHCSRDYNKFARSIVFIIDMEYST